MTPSSLKSWRERLYGARGKNAAAKALGLSQTAYDGYEAGRHRIPLYVALAASAVAFGLPPIGAKTGPKAMFVSSTIVTLRHRP
jgi:hypothetical protein